MKEFKGGRGLNMPVSGMQHVVQNMADLRAKQCKHGRTQKYQSLKHATLNCVEECHLRQQLSGYQMARWNFNHANGKRRYSAWYGPRKERLSKC